MIVGEGVSTRSASGKDPGRQRRGRGGGGIGRGRWAPERAGRGWPARGSGWQGLRRLAGPGRRRRSRRVRRRRRPGGGRAAPYAARWPRPIPDRNPATDHAVSGGPGGDLPRDRRGRRGGGDRGPDREGPERDQPGDRAARWPGTLSGHPRRAGGYGVAVWSQAFAIVPLASAVPRRAGEHSTNWTNAIRHARTHA